MFQNSAVRQALWRSYAIVGTSAVLGSPLLAQGPGKVAPKAPAPVAFAALPGANVISVVANDYSFEMPATVPAGLTTLRFSNRGKEFHHLYLVKVEKGKKPEDILAWFKKGGPPPAWMRPVGGPNAPAPMPGAETVFTSNLTAGDYVALCVIPSPNGGPPHVMKGMIKTLTVTPTTAKVTLPTADITLTLSDYDFTFSKPLTPGKHLIAVRNTGKQPHEYFMGKLNPGKTPMDLAKFAENPVGPPPGLPMGGITDILPGDVVYVQVDVPAGEYAFICFDPDAKDGKPHFAHGMIKQITVK
jgi:hypothetical protein